MPADTPAPKHLHVRVRFTDADRPGARELRFVDQRTFGGLLVVPDGDPVPPLLAHIARDPLDPHFDDDAFVAGLRRRRTGVKRALLDQTLVSGIGNIYADETLWRARLHGERPTDALTRPAARRLLGHARDVLTEAIAAGGTSFDALYVSAEGVSGLFERSLDAYGREGEPCRRCGAPIRRESFMNRSSASCPRCQPRPRGRAAVTRRPRPRVSPALGEASLLCSASTFGEFVSPGSGTVSGGLSTGAGVRTTSPGCGAGRAAGRCRWPPAAGGTRRGRGPPPGRRRARRSRDVGSRRAPPGTDVPGAARCGEPYP